MSRLNDLLRRLENADPALAKDLRREVDALADRRAFGLNFERHVPEAVELPGRPVRRGDKVRVLPPRGSKASAGDDRLWRVVAIAQNDAGARAASLELMSDESETAESHVDDLVVVAEFRDPIYPGLVSTGKVERGGDKPFHSVINAENYHALQSLLFTHREAVDLIYIDPPYNTGNEWTYNDRFVGDTDLYRHSKWLAFLERRLRLAKKLLSSRGVLCVSIGDDEVHRLKLLLDQIFDDKTVQVISVQTTAGGKSTSGLNSLHDYLVCVTPDDFVPQPTSFTGGVSRTPWEGLVLATFDRTQRPNQAYPIFVDSTTGAFHSTGRSLAELIRTGSFKGDPKTFRFEIDAPPGTVAVWPITTKGEECVWRLIPDRLASDWEKGFIKISPNRRKGDRNKFSLQYLPSGVIKKVESGEIPTIGTEAGGITLTLGENQTAGAAIPSIWNEKHHRTSVGTDHLKGVLGDKRFPYPKPVPFVADVVAGFAELRNDAVILDFFGGSGTTAEAVATLNAADGGNRVAIVVTNNEISLQIRTELERRGIRAGDREWEQLGVYEYVTRPRLETVFTGIRADGSSYSNGLPENIEFFDLTYEAPLRVSSNREFAKIAPLLWLRAGSRGRRIEDISTGWDIADTYGVLADLNQSEAFVEAVAAKRDARIAYVVTDEDRLFESVVRELPDHVEPVRLYEAYLQNFEIETGRSAL